MDHGEWEVVKGRHGAELQSSLSRFRILRRIISSCKTILWRYISFQVYSVVGNKGPEKTDTPSWCWCWDVQYATENIEQNRSVEWNKTQKHLVNRKSHVIPAWVFAGHLAQN